MRSPLCFKSFSSNLLVIKVGGFRGKNCAKNRQKKLVGFLANMALKMYLCGCDCNGRKEGIKPPLRQFQPTIQDRAFPTPA